ncbi:unnamed protein product [Camellia sinensis]
MNTTTNFTEPSPEYNRTVKGQPGSLYTPTVADPWQFHSGATTTSRDSDASFCSSINRSASVLITDRSYQLFALRTINSYLSPHSPQISLKPPLPSAKDITETLKFVISRLEFPSNKLEEDLYVVLKHLNCPIKLNKSALRAPGTPHSWPNLLAVIHWLVQVAMYNDHLNDSSQVRSIFEDNSMFIYTMNSYLHFIRGDDDSMEMLDREFMEKLQYERESVEESLKLVEANFRELEAKLKSLRTEPSVKELLEKEKSVLVEDKVLEEKEKELEAKVGENKKICEENEELKKRVLNGKGSTPAAVLGIDYKSTIKPALTSSADEIKKSSMAKLEELISLQQQSVETATKIEQKKNRITALQSRIDEVEAQLNLLRKETQDYTSRCVAEAKKILGDVEADTHKLDIVEREAAVFSEGSEQKLQEAIIQDEEETQMCAQELFQLVDSVSKYKEYMASKILEMKSALSETVESVSDMYKGSLRAQFDTIG